MMEIEHVLECKDYILKRLEFYNVYYTCNNSSDIGPIFNGCIYVLRWNGCNLELNVKKGTTSIIEQVVVDAGCKFPLLDVCLFDYLGHYEDSLMVHVMISERLYGL